MSREKMYQVSILGGQTNWLVLESKLPKLLSELEREGVTPEVKECNRDQFNRMTEFSQST